MSRIRRNTIALGLSFAGTAIAYFLQLKILTSFLAQGEFGVWVAVSALGVIFGTFAEAGLPLVLARYGAKYHAEGRAGALAALMRASLSRLALVAGVIGVFLLVAAPHIGRLIGNVEITRELLLLGYAASLTATLRGVNSACFRGLRRMSVVAVLDVAFAAIVTTGYFLLRARLSAELALIIFSGTGLLVAAAGWLALKETLRDLPVGSRRQTSARSVLREVRGFWQGAAASAILFGLTDQIDKPVLATLATFEVVALFHIPSRLMRLAQRLLCVPFDVMSPEITHKWESGRERELRADLRLFMKLTLGCGFAIMLILTAFAQPLVLLLSTPEYLSGVTAVWGFAAAIPLLCLQQPLVMFLQAIGRVWYAFLSDGLAAAVYLGAGVLLFRMFGLPGFVAGLSVASLVALGYCLLVFDHLQLPRPSLRFFVDRVLMAAGFWTSGVLVGWALPRYGSWQVSVVFLGMALLANFLAVRFQFLDPEEERRTLALLTGRGAAAHAAHLLFAWPRRVWPTRRSSEP